MKHKEDYFKTRLAEPWLLDQAVLLDVVANEEPLAVPVGEFRRGGHLEFGDRTEAEKAVKLLEGRDEFPNPRIIDLAVDYFEVRWGEPPPFDGCDYTEPICALLLGIHYGYSDKAIAKQVRQYTGYPRRTFAGKTMASLIQSARKPR